MSADLVENLAHEVITEDAALPSARLGDGDADTAQQSWESVPTSEVTGSELDNGPVQSRAPEDSPLRERSRTLLGEFKHALKTGDLRGALSACDSLIEVFNQASGSDSTAIFPDILNATRALKFRIKKPAKQPRRPLIEAMFRLGEVISTSSKATLEERFLANYRYYWCTKQQPYILHDPEVDAKVKAGLDEALACALLLIPALERNGNFRSKYTTWMSFWNRVAQIQLARWSLGYAASHELPSILIDTIAALEKIVQTGAGVHFKKVRYNRIKLAACLHWLGLLRGEQQQWRLSNLHHLQSEHWFAVVARSDPAKQSQSPQALLAEFYFSHKEFKRAFELAKACAAQEQSNRPEDLRGGGFHYFLSRLIRIRGFETLDFLLDLIAAGLPHGPNLIALSALAQLANSKNERILAEAANWFYVKRAEELELPEIIQIPAEYRFLLVDRGVAMSAFVADCESRINGNQASTRIELLSAAVAGSRAISFDQKEDIVLLSLLAQAHARIGDYAFALTLFARLLEIDLSPENQSITMFLCGDVYLATGDATQAAMTYEASYAIGGHPAALFKAALARTHANDYDQAIQHLQLMLSFANPNTDEAPHQTRTALAQAYWGRYCLDEKSGGRNEADVVEACRALIDVLGGKIGTRHVHDVDAIGRFVDMLGNPIATKSLADFLRNNWDAPQISLIGDALGRRHTYPKAIIELALERLSEPKLWEEVKKGFVRILSKALARAYHYGETDGLSFEELTRLIVTRFSQFSSGAHQEWLSELLLVEQRASMSELIERYADEAMKVFAPIMGPPEDAIRALGDPTVLGSINAFLLKRMPPATEPVAYGHSDSVDLQLLTTDLIDDLSYELAEPIKEGSKLSLHHKNGSSTVSWMTWIDRIRPFMLSLMDIPRNAVDDSAKSPLALLAAEASPWSIQFLVQKSKVEIWVKFHSIEPTHNPTAILEKAEQSLKHHCECSEIKDLVQLNLRELESEHAIRLTVNVPRAVCISKEFDCMSTFVTYLKTESHRTLTGGHPNFQSYRQASILFSSAFQHVRQTSTDKWVEFIRHLLDLRYVMAARWLLFLPLEGDGTGRHPRSTVHALKQKVQLAMLKQAEGSPISAAELADLRLAQFRLAANILFASRDDFCNMPRLWLKSALKQVVNEFSNRLHVLQFSIFCAPDAYACIHRQLFSRVMFNLIHNAVTATMATEMRLVEVRVIRDDESWVRISVLNHYDSTRDRTETGTGIGLEEVNYVVGRLSGGNVTVRQDRNHGEFEVSLLLPGYGGDDRPTMKRYE